MVYSALDHLTESKCLVLASDDEHNFPGVHYCLDTNGQSHSRDSLEIIVEESAVVQDGLVSESLDPSSGFQRRSRLVECNVTICSSASSGSESVKWPHLLQYHLGIDQYRQQT